MTGDWGTVRMLLWSNLLWPIFQDWRDVPHGEIRDLVWDEVWENSYDG
jgi:hypothetical protein